MKIGVKNKKIIAAAVLSIACFPWVVLAACDPNDIVCNPLKYDTFQQLIDALTNTLFVIALALTPLMFVWAGFLFATANGEPNKLSKAKSIMLWTSIGLGIMLIAKAIVWAIRGVLGT